jgi:hypothetical protein
MWKILSFIPSTEKKKKEKKKKKKREQRPIRSYNNSFNER